MRNVQATKPDPSRREAVRVDEWLLTAAERGNPWTGIDRRRAPGTAWSLGNDLEFLIHGKYYFAALLSHVSNMRRGDLLLFTDWRGDPDERLDGPGTEVSRVLSDAARRGVVVKGLVWRSHLDRLRFSAAENRHLGEEIEAAGGECLLDMRVRAGGSHHQKLVVLRHPGRPECDVAFVGGIDLCHSRRDDERHLGDPQRQPMARIYGDRPPWHDVQVAIRGPAVTDVETVFRERWEDPTPLTRNPLRHLADLVRREDTSPGALPPQQPDPPTAGPHAVQVLRTYPRRWSAYPFAPEGERSVARAYAKAFRRARALIYLEDQYLWSREVSEVFARALRTQPELRIIAVVPHVPDQDGPLSMPPNLIGRQAALDALYAAGHGRVAIYGIENELGTPIYVHAKVGIVDDVWAAVGSDNINRRSWTYDSELSVAAVEVGGEDGAFEVPGPAEATGASARRLRLALSCEHLGRDPGDTDDLLEPVSAFRAFARSAAMLQAWYDDGRREARPPGRLRPARATTLDRRTRMWAAPLYQWLYDPDGRPRSVRRSGTF
jgi:phosphatidylserine/phosphatidylglycerophosphate/cardiolipin synthase-like enzyme